MARLVPLLLLTLAGCEDGSSMPPCSAMIVVGTVTFDCDAAHLARKPTTNATRPQYPAQ